MGRLSSHPFRTVRRTAGRTGSVSRCPAGNSSGNRTIKRNNPTRRKSVTACPSPPFVENHAEENSGTRPADPLRRQAREAKPRRQLGGISKSRANASGRPSKKGKRTRCRGNGVPSAGTVCRARRKAPGIGRHTERKTGRAAEARDADYLL